jgi:thiamine kinase-like enzyme
MKKLGEASTVAEKAAESAIQQVDVWKNREVHYHPITGGLSNSNWRIEISGDAARYFLKVPGAGTEKFINRVVTNQIGKQAFDLGIGPEPFHFDPQTGVEIMLFLEGYRCLTNFDFKDLKVTSEVLAVYKKFHSGNLLGITKTQFDMVDEHLQQANELKPKLPADMPWLVDRYTQAKQAMLAAGLDMVPCFNDPIPGNFMVKQAAPMKLVDFEFSSNNDRSCELGVLLGEMFIAEEDCMALLESYYGKVTQSTFSRFQLGRAVADMKWGLWGIVNRKLSSWDFDYHKYGIWKLKRARSVILDQRWDWWLRSL